MKVIEVQNQGKNSTLILGNRPIPKISPDEVLIKVHTSGVNRADIFQKQGLYPPPQGVSDVLGLEVCGIIEKKGSKVQGFNVGDKVCALLEGGGYASYAKAYYKQIFPLPDNLNFIEGASLPEALYTAYSNMFHYAKLKRGESLFMHGGTSGIGVFVAQIAHNFGIDFYTSVGSDDKLRFISNLTKCHAVNYNKNDFVQWIKEKTASRGVNVIIDIVGGDYFQRNIKCLSVGGRLICLSFLKGANIDANIAPIVFKELTIMGSTLRSKNKKEKALITKGLMKNLWPLLQQGAIKPIISGVFSIEEIALAHKKMESGDNIGKIILKF